MNVGHIAGGTRSGWRRVKQAHKPWRCFCVVAGNTIVVPGEGDVRADVFDLRVNPGYRVKCDDCGETRPT